MGTIGWIHSERYSSGKYFVYHENKRIGHIVGAKSSWLAEQGPIDCGYHKSKKLAINAIREMYLSRIED